jgi:tetrahydromethanopterin S-methyltransferase subunit H
MHSFMRQQEVVEIGGVKFGGQPGENPTVLIGTVFYGRDFKVLDEPAYAKAAELVAAQEDIAEETGLPGLVDVYIRDEKSAKREIDTLLSATDKPFSIDSSDAAARAKALEILDEAGALDRAIYNSVNLGATAEELKALEKHTPAAAIVLGYNPRDMSVDGRMEILDGGAGMLCVPAKGIIDLARDCGIGKLLIDTGATPFGSMSAETLRAIPVFKNRYGLPVGCSIHNTLESWAWMKERRKNDPEAYNAADAAANALVPLMSGDFIVYGPAANSRRIFPAVAFANKLIAEGAKDYFGTKVSEGHPYNRLK